MPVSHAPVSSRALNTAGQERAPGLLEDLALVADPRRRRGRRFTLAFTLAVAVVCVSAGARSFREIGDQAADLPQEVPAALGGVPCPLRRKIAVPSEKRIRTLLQDLDGDALDAVIGGWLRSLAAAAKPARPDGPAEHVAIDGKWLRGVGDGPVKLFSALQRDHGVIIAPNPEHHPAIGIGLSDFADPMHFLPIPCIYCATNDPKPGDALGQPLGLPDGRTCSTPHVYDISRAADSGNPALTM